MANIFDPTGKTGQAGIKVDLKPGDMLIYSGCDLNTGEKKLQVKTVDKYFYITIKLVQKQLKKTH